MERKLSILPDHPSTLRGIHVTQCLVFIVEVSGTLFVILYFVFFSIWLGFIQNHDPCLLRITSSFSCIHLSVHVVIYVGDDQIHRLHFK